MMRKNNRFTPESVSNIYVLSLMMLLMLLSKLQGGCKSPFLAQKKTENQITMLSIVLHGIVWYCMEFLCILWYPIVFMSFHCIVWYCMVLYYILRYCMVLHCWLRRVGCISQDTYLLYDNDSKHCNNYKCCSAPLFYDLGLSIGFKWNQSSVVAITKFIKLNQEALGKSKLSAGVIRVSLLLNHLSLLHM